MEMMRWQKHGNISLVRV